MIQRNKFSDARLDAMCVYCGDFPNTRDHVPSKVLLDEPFPENIHNVPCCYACNQGLSTDEEYFACIIECLIHGSVEIEKLSRPKIKRILSKKHHLHKKIIDAIRMNKEKVEFEIDYRAFNNVLLKLSKGHAAFETSEPQLRNPSTLMFKDIYSMTIPEREIFFACPELEKYPEIGSRLFQQAVLSEGNIPYSIWITVQENSYSYMVNSSMSQLTVRLFIFSFLAVEAIWDN